jgi:hypothetical protein
MTKERLCNENFVFVFFIIIAIVLARSFLAAAHRYQQRRRRGLAAVSLHPSWPKLVLILGAQVWVVPHGGGQKHEVLHPLLC